MRVAIVLCLLVACGDTTDAQLGGFTVRHDGSTLTFAHQGGLSLTTAPGVIARSRKAAATYEHQFGAYRIQERALGEPRVATQIGGFEAEGANVKAELRDAAGEVFGELTLSEVQGSLQITILAPGADRAALALACDPIADGDYLGFGAQTHDVDHRGQVVPIWVEEQGIGKADTDEYSPLWPLVGTRHSSYLPVPSVIAPRAAHSYGLRSTTLERSIWDVCATKSDTLMIEAFSSEIAVQIAPGPTPLEVLAQQTQVTGRPPLGPEWTFGVWMEAIGGRPAIEAEVARLEAAGVPTSALWTEDWRGGNSEGNMYVLEEDWRADAALYPDLSGMIRQLHERGIRFMTYFNTFIVEDADVFEEAVRDGHLVKKPDGTPYFFDGVTFKRTGLAELFNPPTREWVRRELESALSMGIDGWMADFAEWYPAETRDVVAPSGYTAPAAHQQYPVEWAKVNREAVTNSGRDDVVIFHRSGYSGSQPHAHVIWIGDQRTSFDVDDGLPTVIPLMLGLSMTGFPVVTHDIGGYISATNPPTSRELFFRWTSLGALGPVMRTHHGRNVDQNWRWSSDAATTLHFVRWSRWHMRHAPLWRGLARDATELGAPILVPLALTDPSDARLSGIRDEYLIGDEYLVAPVVTASTTRRTVILPRGTWYPLHARGPRVDGPTELEVDVPLTEVALWARAGAIVPQTDGDVPTLNRPEDLARIRARRVVEVYLGADGKTTDGDGGRWALTSPRPPTGMLELVEGGTPLTRTATVIEIEAAADARLALREADGTTHQLQGTGHSPGLRALYRFLW